jgi:hypothetical protein
VGFVYGIGFAWQPLMSIGYNFVWKNFRAPGMPPAIQVASAAWHGMPMRPFPGEASGPAEDLQSAGNYAAWLNDGLAVLSASGSGYHSVVCLDWTNPFPFATGTAPPLGDELNWHVGRFIGPSNHPDVSALLDAADVVMEPLRSIQPGSLSFKKMLFSSALRESFIVFAETEHWRAWRRRDTRRLPLGPASARYE